LHDANWTPDDRAWLLSYLENSDSTELETLMAQLYKRDLASDTPLEPAISALMRQHIAARTGIDMQQVAADRPQINPNKPGQSRSDPPALEKRNLLPYRKLYRWAAAAVLLLLTGGAWIYLAGIHASSATAHNHSKTSDATPGSSKAFLTLSDGRTIVLDSTATGELVLQGNTKVMKVDSGSLTYQASSSPNQPPAAKSPAPETANPPSETYNTITTPRGGQYQVRLSDGTKVWLNAASRLKFPTAFNGKQRVVELTGEAYFEVAKETVPFIVHVPPADRGTAAVPLDITVLGTHFNVNAYQDEPVAKATLLEGSIRISKGAGSNLLQPGQQAVADNGSTLIQLNNDADLDEAVAWKNGMFIFNSLSLEAIMRQMERWYDVEVRYEGNIKKTSFNGQISRYSNAAKMLDMLQTTGEIHFTIENRTITVHP